MRHPYPQLLSAGNSQHNRFPIVTVSAPHMDNYMRGLPESHRGSLETPTGGSAELAKTHAIPGAFRNSPRPAGAPKGSIMERSGDLKLATNLDGNG
eukprot:4776478-Alexandrium_andersonii.AAC.1